MPTSSSGRSSWSMFVFQSHHSVFFFFSFSFVRFRRKVFPDDQSTSKSDSVSRQRFWHADITCYWYSCCAQYVPLSCPPTCTRCFPKTTTPSPPTGTSTVSETMCPIMNCPGTWPRGSRLPAIWARHHPALSWILCPNKPTFRSGDTTLLNDSRKRLPWKNLSLRKNWQTRPDSEKLSLTRRHKRYFFA